MIELLGIVGFAALFAAFGLLMRGMRRAPRCDGCGGGCDRTCEKETQGEVTMGRGAGRGGS